MESAQLALVVDDDEAIQYYHSVCLDTMGIASVTVGTGHEALTSSLLSRSTSCCWMSVSRT